MRNREPDMIEALSALTEEQQCFISTLTLRIAMHAKKKMDFVMSINDFLAEEGLNYRVVSVEGRRDGYRCRVEYEDGREVTVNLPPGLHGVSYSQADAALGGRRIVLTMDYRQTQTSSG